MKCCRHVFWLLNFINTSNTYTLFTNNRACAWLIWILTSMCGFPFRLSKKNQDLFVWYFWLLDTLSVENVNKLIPSSHKSSKECQIRCKRKISSGLINTIKDIRLDRVALNLLFGWGRLNYPPPHRSWPNGIADRFFPDLFNCNFQFF